MTARTDAHEALMVHVLAICPASEFGRVMELAQDYGDACGQEVLNFWRDANIADAARKATL